MLKVFFNYQGNITIIQCKKEDKIKNVCLKFISKTGADINNLYFIYNGINLNLEQSFFELINSLDNNRNEMNILVYNTLNTSIIKDNPVIKSKDIICPKCSNNCLISLDNFKISLYGCKNGHKIDNILINEFEQTQNINELKIICNKCYNNKLNTNNHQFYKCLSCNSNLCPLCNLNHNKDHTTIDYDKKNYICNIHNDSFISYCENCKINLCMICEKNHSNHKIIFYRDIFPNIDEVKNEINNYKNMIELFIKDIDSIILKLKSIISNLQNYYNICFNIINNFEIQNKNYYILKNYNEAKKNLNIDNLKKIIDINNINDKFQQIIMLYNDMNDKSEKTQFDPSLYEKYGLTREEILEYKEAFDLYDNNNNGYVNSKELLSGLKNLDMKNNKTLQKIIESIEKSNQKEITFDEFINLLVDPNEYDSEKYLISIFSSLLKENKDKIDFEDFIRKKPNKNIKDEEIKKILIQADRDKDGKLSYDEFVVAANEMIKKNFV